MKRIIAIMLTVILMMSVSLAEVVASPTLPVLKPTEIRNDKGEVMDSDSGLIVEVVPHEEAKEKTAAAVVIAEKKAEEITKAFAAILPAVLPTIPSIAVPAVPTEPAAQPELVPETEPVAPATVEEVKQQVEAAYVEVFGEEAVEELKVVMETVPEVSVGDMTIDEIVPLYVGGYEEHMGDVHVVVESVTEYKDTDVLVAMIGILLTEEEIAAAAAEAEAAGEVVETVEAASEEAAEEEHPIKWIPLNATVEEGKVVIAFTEDAMKMADGRENIMVLMRAHELEAA